MVSREPPLLLLLLLLRATHLWSSASTTHACMARFSVSRLTTMPVRSSTAPRTHTSTR